MDSGTSWELLLGTQRWSASCLSDGRRALLGGRECAFVDVPGSLCRERPPPVGIPVGTPIGTHVGRGVPHSSHAHALCRTILLGDNRGEGGLLDCRQRRLAAEGLTLAGRKVNTLHLEPGSERLFVSASTDAAGGDWAGLWRGGGGVVRFHVWLGAGLALCMPCHAVRVWNLWKLGGQWGATPCTRQPPWRGSFRSARAHPLYSAHICPYPTVLCLQCTPCCALLIGLHTRCCTVLCSAGVGPAEAGGRRGRPGTAPQGPAGGERRPRRLLPGRLLCSRWWVRAYRHMVCAALAPCGWVCRRHDDWGLRACSPRTVWGGGL